MKNSMENTFWILSLFLVMNKVNVSVISGGLPDVITVDGPNISVYAANNIIQPLSNLSEEEKSIYLP